MERVWWREGQQVLTYLETVCRLQRWTARVNGQVDRARQLAADNFVALLMRDDNKVFFFFGGEASTTLGWCGQLVRSLLDCVVFGPLCLMNCPTHGTNHEHERHEQG